MRRPSPAEWGLIGLVGLGIVLRVRQFAAMTGFWGDEAMLLVNLLERPWGRLLSGPLDYYPMTQVAPPAFMAAEKLAMAWGGINEASARAVPLVCSILGLAAIAVLARRLLSPWWAVGLTGVVAMSRALVEQSANAKQYSGDVLATTLLLLAATSRSPRRMRWTSLVAAVAAWASHTVAIVFAGVLLAELVGGRRRWMTLAMALPGAVSLAALYWFNVRVQQTPYMSTFWAKGFVPWGRGPVAVVAWAVEAGRELFSLVAPNAGWALALGAVAGGWWAARRWSAAWGMMVACVGVAFVIAALAKYPVVNDRVCHYLAPVTLLLGVMGLEALAGRLAHWWRVAPAALLAVALVTNAGHSFSRLIKPKERSSAREDIAYLRLHRLAGEPVYAYGSGRSSVLRLYWPGADDGVHLMTEGPVPADVRRFWVLPRPTEQRKSDGLRLINDADETVDRIPARAIAQHRQPLTARENVLLVDRDLPPATQQ